MSADTSKKSHLGDVYLGFHVKVSLNFLDAVIKS